MKKSLVRELLLITLLLAGFPLPAEELDLAKWEKGVFSQNGEDGVIEKIFELIPPSTRYAVEFGAGDGVNLSNTRNLVLHGWSALMIEGVPRKAEKCKRNYRDQPRVAVVQAWVYPGNVELLFEENNVPVDLDLLSIDIDSNDYYVWRVINKYRPKVVLIEYNPYFAPPKKAVIKFHPMNYYDDNSCYWGASIQSLYELGKAKGYELVHCTSRGSNLFFVDKKYFERFKLADNSPAKLYRPQKDFTPETAPTPTGEDLVVPEFRIKKEWIFDRY
ncbi:MAG TPA: hypothetical protein P5079_11600 [Elusimicrobiota bacterium]|nr:hypothetical protein [Elusimicrobiota bacterium]